MVQVAGGTCHLYMSLHFEVSIIEKYENYLFEIKNIVTGKYVIVKVKIISKSIHYFTEKFYYLCYFL